MPNYKCILLFALQSGPNYGPSNRWLPPNIVGHRAAREGARSLIGRPGARIIDVREPLGSRRNSFKLGEFRGAGSCVYRPKFLDLVISIQI